ncbi:MAG: endonuclease/exonuclease/phosphatase family protein [Gammaproteobacteria bacterium]
MPELRVITFNTWKCDGNYLRRLDILVEALTELDPDLLLLQEAFRSDDGEHDTAGRVARELGLHCSYHPARFKPRALNGAVTPSGSGLAILSRDLPVNGGAIRLEQDPRDGDRWAQWADLDVEGLAVRVINTHLTHLDDREDLRQRQLGQIVEFATGESRCDVTVLGGDFNTEPNGPAMGALEGLAQGAWEATDGKPPPATCPVDAPGLCIDHLYRFITENAEASWKTMERVLDSPHPDGLFPSDHAGLMGCLQIEPSR